jgi:glycosyltransferase involved in cell wall biosynthesis
MRIVQVNAAYDPSLKTPQTLLDAYHTLTEWSAALKHAGAAVIVVQRFHTAGTISRDGVVYEFVVDREPPWLSTTGAPKELVGAIAAHQADLIHVNGLIFPQLVNAIRAGVGPSTAIVVQHHGGEFPIRGSGLVGMWQRRGWRSGLAAADALSFTAAEQAAPWRDAGLIGGQRIIEVIEASTSLRHVERDRARQATGLTGDPLILWVGRLTTNKDPLTVLDGLERALPRLANARVAMVFGDDTLLSNVVDRVNSSETLRDRVSLSGQVAHEEMPSYYGASDVYVSGSHTEGSGYALIEAMSAGLVPVVTDIPSFRVIAGECGAQWTPGNADAFAEALIGVCHGDLDREGRAARTRFDRELSWRAIAHKTLEEYETLLTTRPAQAR